MPKWIDNTLDRTLTRLGYQKATAGGPHLAVLAGETPQLPAPGLLSTEEADKAARLAINSAWAYSCMRAKAQMFAAAKFFVRTQVGEQTEEIEAHSFERLISRPNPHWSRALLWQYLSMSMDSRGRAFWLLVPDITGELREIWPIPADRCEPIPDAANYLAGFAYRPIEGREPVRLPLDAVAFFKYPNPFDYHDGLSPLTAARVALRTDMAAARWNEETFKSEANVRTVISLDKDISAPDFNSLKADLLRDLTENRLRYLIARGGDVDVKSMGLSQKDAEFLAGREFTREEIGIIYGFPAGYWSKDATRANVEGARAIVLEGTVYPLHILVAETITTQILPRYGDNLVGEFEDVRVRDRALAVSEQTARRGYWTVNELRSVDGKPALTGGEWETLPAEAALKMYGGTTAASEPPAMATTAVPGEIKAELKRWRGVCLRQLRDGKGAAYEFKSEIIPPDVRRGIWSALLLAATPADVEAIFDDPTGTKAARVLPAGASDPLAPVPDTVAIEAADLDRAAMAWYEVFPDDEGMLDAAIEARTDYSDMPEQ